MADGEQLPADDPFPLWDTGDVCDLEHGHASPAAV
jgi:hypothetical protein